MKPNTPPPAAVIRYVLLELPAVALVIVVMVLLRRWLDLPDWLTELDLNFAADEYARTGFRGGLNLYRNLDFNWAQTPFLDGACIRQPSLFIAGELDGSIAFRRQHYEQLEKTMPGLTRKVLLPGVGHWTPEESPEEVNRLLLEFLAGLG